MGIEATAKEITTAMGATPLSEVNTLVVRVPEFTKMRLPLNQKILFL
jgi:hypothetical protein